MAVDYLSALNVGSGLNVTQIVDAIVDAERVPQENVIQKRIDDKTVSVSALGQLKNDLSSRTKILKRSMAKLVLSQHHQTQLYPSKKQARTKLSRLNIT